MNLIASKIFIACAVFVLASSAFADMITIHNQTENNLFAAVYCKVLKGSASQSTGVVKVEPAATAQLDRTSSSFTCRRQLVVAKTPTALVTKINDKDFYNGAVYGNASLGTTSSSGSRLFHNFYADEENGKISISNTASRRLSQAAQLFGKTVDVAVQAYKATLLPSNPAVKANTYANTVAKLRSSNTLPQEERDYLKKRSAKVKVALESLLGKKLNGKYIPKIAFIASGGGARAMLSTVGWHDGADEVGLLDALTYDVGLSGGTWGIGYWLSSGMTPRNFQNTLKTQMTFGILPVKGLESGTIFPTGEESKMILEAMLAKLSYDQPVGLVDFYGGLLANRFLDYLAGQRHVFALHDLRARIANGDVPMPIFTAINADDGTHEKNRHLVRWIEFTPYEVGASWLGGFVPSWGYGRRFVDNQSVDFSPPQSFGFQTGTYGSAFAFDFRRGVEEVLTTAFKNPVIVAGVTKLIEKLANPSAAEFGQTRLSTASVNNFAIDAPGADEDIRDKEHLRFADGGLAFNLPYPPVSGERPERMADVMIFLDASGSLESHGSQEFKLATDYAAAKGLKFPKVTIKDLEKKPISVFMDTNDPSTPVVIYLPRKLKETSMPTLKFVYSAEDFEKMIRLTSGQMRDAATQIIDAIRRNIELNKGF